MTQIIKELKPYKSAIEIFSLFKDEKDAVLLDSSLENDLGRYTIIGLNPYLKLINGEELTVNGISSQQPFAAYTKEYLQDNFSDNPTELPIVAGAIGYFSYEYGRIQENIASRHEDELNIPLCILNFYDNFILEDLAKKQVFIVANGHLQNPQSSIRDLEEKISEIKVGLHRENKEKDIKITPNFIKEDYLKTIDKMINYITEGDIYIANMTQHLAIESLRSPYDVYLKLRGINPSPFGGYLNYGDVKVISASPERFMKMNRGKVTTRPIKGTRKRGATALEDDILREELRHSGKDRSELLMIVDLERNDLNKIAIPGSVKVTELFAVEEYATVFHLVATIEGKLEENLTAMDLIAATFPGGSITGAPKIRAMEIIDELEHSARNIYTGSMGYIALDGAMDLNIIIRTALYKDGTYYLGVGGGITYESELEFEYEETLQKAKAVLEALK